MVWYTGFEQKIFCHVLMQYDQKKLASLKVENQNLPLSVQHFAQHFFDWINS